jgi:hydroxymethylglutaryl-CoA lyase
MSKLLYKNIRYFDTTLRDGLQSYKHVLSLKEKTRLADYIYTTYKPDAIEVGSIVSEKFIPQMKDTLKVYDYCKNKKMDTDLYVLTPNAKSLKKAIDHGVKNFSFITSVSEDFQKKNINKSLNETKEELKQMYLMLDSSNKVKLYVSCIDHCPIAGKLSIENIIIELLYYINDCSNITELCLSDTCGKLKLDSYKELLHEVLAFIESDKISLHLHKSENSDISQIIHLSLMKNINKFDVSSLHLGGCSMTIAKNKLNSNIQYKDVDKKYDFKSQYKI